MIPRASLTSRIAAAGLGALVLAATHAPAPTWWLDCWVFDQVAPVATGPSPVEGVAVTPEDLVALPRFGREPGRWPWKRLAHSAIVHALTQMGAEVVALDLFFLRPGDPASDASLARELREAGVPVALATYQTSRGAWVSEAAADQDLGWEAAHAAGLRLSDQGPAQPLAAPFRDVGARLGIANLPDEGLASHRGLPLVHRDGDRLLPSLALAATLPAGAEPRWEPGPTLVAGALRVPLTPRGEALLRLGKVPRRSVTRLLEQFAESLGPRNDVRGRTFVVGLEGTGLGALHEVSAGQRLPSYQVHAGAARALRAGAILAPLPLHLGIFLLLVLAMATAALPRFGPLTALLAAGFPPALAWGGAWISPTTWWLGAAVALGAPLLLGAGLAELARRTREAEMRRAEDVARGLLPRELPEGVEGFLVPARRAAGDYYDALAQADGSVVAIVADVSGKGLDAALLAGQLRAGFRALASTQSDPATLLAALNQLLTPDLEAAGRLATAVVARRAPDGTVTVVAGGHPPPLHLGLEVTEVAVRGRPLGYGPDTVYRATEVRLRAGEGLVLLSDGVLEQPREPGAPPPRLEGIRKQLAEATGAPVARARGLLVEGASPRDDQTVLVLTATGD